MSFDITDEELELLDKEVHLTFKVKKLNKYGQTQVRILEVDTVRQLVRTKTTDEHGKESRVKKEFKVSEIKAIEKIVGWASRARIVFYKHISRPYHVTFHDRSTRSSFVAILISLNPNIIEGTYNVNAHNNRATCAQCGSKFSFRTRRLKCAICDGIICNRCAVKPKTLASSNSVKTKQMLCASCSETQAMVFQRTGRTTFMLPSPDSAALQGSSRTLQTALGSKKVQGKNVDQYGFKLKEAEAKIEIPEEERKAKQIWQQKHRAKWIEFLGVAISFEPTNELKNLLRAGVPADLRGRAWTSVMGVPQAKAKHPYGYYSKLVEISELGDNKQVASEIDKDCQKTFSDNVMFEDGQGEGISMLRRILLAYSVRNPAVGYCQSLNFLVACFLLLMEEEEAFWLLALTVERILNVPNYLDPDFCYFYHQKDMMGIRLDQNVFANLVQEKLNKIHTKFEDLHVPLGPLTVNWFLCCFVNVLPINLVFRIWDCMFLDGIKALLRASLTLLKVNEPRILLANSTEQLMTFMRAFSHSDTNPNHFIKLMYSRLFLGSFPMSRIVFLRNWHVDSADPLRLDLHPVVPDPKKPASRRETADNLSQADPSVLETETTQGRESAVSGQDDLGGLPESSSFVEDLVSRPARVDSLTRRNPELLQDLSGQKKGADLRLDARAQPVTLSPLGQAPLAVKSVVAGRATAMPTAAPTIGKRLNLSMFRHEVFEMGGGKKKSKRQSMVVGSQDLVKVVDEFDAVAESGDMELSEQEEEVQEVEEEPVEEEEEGEQVVVHQPDQELGQPVVLHGVAGSADQSGRDRADSASSNHHDDFGPHPLGLPLHPGFPYPATAIYPHKPQERRELCIKAGDVLVIFQHNDSGWGLACRKGDGQTGWVPLGYTRMEKTRKEQAIERRRTAQAADKPAAAAAPAVTGQEAAVADSTDSSSSSSDKASPAKEQPAAATADSTPTELKEDQEKESLPSPTRSRNASEQKSSSPTRSRTSSQQLTRSRTSSQQKPPSPTRSRTSSQQKSSPQTRSLNVSEQKSASSTRSRTPSQQTTRSRTPRLVLAATNSGLCEHQVPAVCMLCQKLAALDSPSSTSSSSSDNASTASLPPPQPGSPSPIDLTVTAPDSPAAGMEANSVTPRPAELMLSPTHTKTIDEQGAEEEAESDEYDSSGDSDDEWQDAGDELDEDAPPPPDSEPPPKHSHHSSVRTPKSPAALAAAPATQAATSSATTSSSAAEGKKEPEPAVQEEQKAQHTAEQTLLKPEPQEDRSRARSKPPAKDGSSLEVPGRRKKMRKHSLPFLSGEGMAQAPPAPLRRRALTVNDFGTNMHRDLGRELRDLSTGQDGLLGDAAAATLPPEPAGPPGAEQPGGAAGSKSKGGLDLPRAAKLINSLSGHLEQVGQELEVHRCGSCREQVQSRSVWALGKYWHSEHFRCTGVCGQPMAGQQYFIQDHQPYCKTDFLSLFGKRCGACGKYVLDGLELEDKTNYHPKCLKCQTCGALATATDLFKGEAGFFCKEHFHGAQAGVCHKCSKPIHQGGVAMGSKCFHSTCLLCAVCGQELSAAINSPLGVLESRVFSGAMYCGRHHSHAAPPAGLCPQCNEPRGLGPCVPSPHSPARDVHKVCMRCAKCAADLSETPRKQVHMNGKEVLCSLHYEAMAPPCTACKKLIADQVDARRFGARGDGVLSVFHSDCVRCGFCKRFFPQGQPVLLHPADGLPYCREHTPTASKQAPRQFQSFSSLPPLPPAAESAGARMRALTASAPMKRAPPRPNSARGPGPHSSQALSSALPPPPRAPSPRPQHEQSSEATHCASCKESLHGKVLTLGKHKYHEVCLVCRTCKATFPQLKGIYNHEDHIYCQQHYAQQIAAKCHVCGESITAGQVANHTHNGKPVQIHGACFKCAVCSNSLINAPFLSTPGGFRCSACIDK
eukprot:g48.t1